MAVIILLMPAAVPVFSVPHFGYRMDDDSSKEGGVANFAGVNKGSNINNKITIIQPGIIIGIKGALCLKKQ